MRLIKFRVWSPTLKQYFFDSWINVSDGRQILYLHTGNEIEIVNDPILEQFTGLFDKNGKEIYEGDIIKWGIGRNHSAPDNIRQGFMTVEWKNHGFVAQLDPEQNSCDRLGWGNAYDVFEVIGNIHENCAESIPDKGPAQCKHGHWIGLKQHPIGESITLAEALIEGIIK